MCRLWAACIKEIKARHGLENCLAFIFINFFQFFCPSISSVGTSPDIHFLCLFNQIVPELRMGYGDQRLRFLPGRNTFPYSVTNQWILALVSVTMEPLARVGRILDTSSPCLFLKVEEQQIKLFPPLER